MPWVIRTIITIFFMTILIYAYISWRVINALTTISTTHPRSIYIFVIPVFLFLNLLPIWILVSYLTGIEKHLFLFKDHLHWLDYLLLYPYWFGLIIIIECLPYFLCLDIFSIIFHLFGSTFQKYWTQWQAILKIVLVLFFVCYVGIRSYFDTNHIRIRSFHVPIKNLPVSFQNLSITLTGDIQIDRYTGDEKIEQFQNQLKKANGDLLLFSGDLVTDGKRYVSRGVQELCKTHAPLERVACLGDHDFWSDPVRISRDLKSCGWKFLQNEHFLFHYKDQKILITGITYIYSKRISVYELRSLLETAPEADLKILLVHQPVKVVLEMAEEYDYHLLLAGHSHGGQFVFRPFGIPLTPSQFENQIYSGYEKYGRLPVVVTNGIGLTLAPLRYQAPAEITTILLVKE